MKAILITFCLIGAAFANPIFQNVLESSQLDSNSTESLSVSESAENNTSEVQSSEENVSNNSSESESESVESTSEDTTSEESDSQSDEDDGMDSMPETQDDSMGSQENVRKQSWVSVFPNVVKALSAEDNTSTEAEGQSKDLSHEMNKKHPMTHKTGQRRTNQALLDTTSDSADISAAASNSNSNSSSSESESASNESHESNESNESNESDTSSESTEDSNELEQIQTKECVNGTQSCESEENLLQSIGDDAHFSVDNLTVPDEDDRELRLRR